jgi:hypothetical protein
MTANFCPHCKQPMHSGNTIANPKKETVMDWKMILLVIWCVLFVVLAGWGMTPEHGGGY